MRLYAFVFGFLMMLMPVAHAAPQEWQIGMMPAASEVQEQIIQIHDTILVPVIIAISVFVLALLVICAVKFNRKANPVPSTTSHNTTLEIIWTALPVIILVVIAIPSFRLIYFMDKAENPEMTLKVTGHQWYWAYEYPDHGNIAFDAYMVPSDSLKEGQVRLLSTDNEVVLPVDTSIRILITAADVLHSWAMPSFGVKKDAIPGRLNETWVKITKPGVYYGQCSEICGVNHAYMPITVRAVSKEDFARWVEEAKEKFADNSDSLVFAQKQSVPDIVSEK